jgi:hypothetical protein
MNAKQIVAAVSLALAGSAAMAVEATQFEVPASTLTRAEVKAELAQARLDGTLISSGEATVFADAPVASIVSRNDVRADARQALRADPFNALYVGA